MGDIYYDFLKKLHFILNYTNGNNIKFIFYNYSNCTFYFETLEDFQNIFNIAPYKCDISYEIYDKHVNIAKNNLNLNDMLSKIYKPHVHISSLNYLLKKRNKKEKNKKNISYIFYSDTCGLNEGQKNLSEKEYIKIKKLFDTYKNKINFLQLYEYQHDVRRFEKKNLKNSNDVISKNIDIIYNSDYVFCSEGFWSHISYSYNIPTLFYTKNSSLSVYEEYYKSFECFEDYYKKVKIITEIISEN